PEDRANVELRWIADDKEFIAKKAAIVPLRLNQTTIGVLCVGRYQGESFTCSALIGLGNLADQAVIAIEHAMMTARLQSLAVTEERSRIAREMHDGLAQLLGYLGLQTQTLEALVKQGDSEAVLQELKQARAMIKSAQADVRENILSLRTTLAGETTLSEALQAYVEEFGIQAGVITQFVNDTAPTPCLSPLAETQCVRIVQEALTNIRKHAHAEHVWVDMAEQAGYLSITITDDGIGLQGGTASRRHFGLQTMHERAQSVQGSFVIESTPGQGTRITLNLPLMS
ncbi:MAG: GAF domain-containing sensor histidine kinase, partial [Anaerolineae bacterium]|nr:GAF domain-containing sensor histidine kinase [Anaerolineae bacterium]